MTQKYRLYIQLAFSYLQYFRLNFFSELFWRYGVLAQRSVRCDLVRLLALSKDARG